jgi:hypothetical protein
MILTTCFAEIAKLTGFNANMFLELSPTSGQAVSNT